MAYENGIDTLEEYGANKKKARRRTAEPAGRTGPRAYARRPAGNNLKRRFPERDKKTINDILKNPEEPAEKKGLLLRSIVDRIVYEKASGTMYFDFFVSCIFVPKVRKTRINTGFFRIIWY